MGIGKENCSKRRNGNIQTSLTIFQPLKLSNNHIYSIIIQLHRTQLAIGFDQIRKKWCFRFPYQSYPTLIKHPLKIWRNRIKLEERHIRQSNCTKINRQSLRPSLRWSQRRWSNARLRSSHENRPYKVAIRLHHRHPPNLRRITNQHGCNKRIRPPLLEDFLLILSGLKGRMILSSLDWWLSIMKC